MRFIAFYLPQFHEIPENDRMWGKGFTEWTNVRKAKPLFQDHFQPVEPLDDNYYNLTDANVIRWQAELAKKYGIYGFCFYHYWYNGHLLLEKPLELFLSQKDIDIPYCICWANHDWTYAWVGKQSTVIFSQEYDNPKEWKEHFDYMLPFFKDDRYMKTNGKPLLVIYDPYKIERLNEILKYWKGLAVENGFEGIDFAFQSPFADTDPDFDDSEYTYDIEYQPEYARVFSYQSKQISRMRFLHKINDMFFKFDWNMLRDKFKKAELTKLDYDDVWETILHSKVESPKRIPGCFVNVDTTPRKQEMGVITEGMNPGKLEGYLKRLIRKTRDEYNKDMIFIYAWNEWAEGAYMEPDKRWGYGVLEAFKNALIDTGEWNGEDERN